MILLSIDTGKKSLYDFLPTEIYGGKDRNWWSRKKYFRM